MDMNFDQYISNPMGKKNAVFGQREVLRDVYTRKLDAIIVREVGKIKYELYKTKNNERYFIHFKMPSEVIPDFYYDTVIEFYTNDHATSLSKSLSKYNVRFFSNDPSFVFTFAHAMKANDMFIDDLKSKMSNKALKSAGKVRNPKSEVGYVKSIFFAYLLMKNYGLFAKVQFDSYAKPYNPKELLSNIEHADKKIEDRMEAEENLKISKKKEKKNKKQDDDLEQQETNPINVKTVEKPKKIKKVDKVGTTKSNKVKKVKKI